MPWCGAASSWPSLGMAPAGRFTCPRPVGRYPERPADLGTTAPLKYPQPPFPACPSEVAPPAQIPRGCHQQFILYTNTLCTLQLNRMECVPLCIPHQAIWFDRHPSGG